MSLQSTKGQSWLDLNVSFLKNDRVVKTNFRIIEMTGTTTAADIVAACPRQCFHPQEQHSQH